MNWYVTNTLMNLTHEQVGHQHTYELNRLTGRSQTNELTAVLVGQRHADELIQELVDY